MATVCNPKVGKLVCEALGLDPKVIRSITLRLVADEVATALVEHLPTEAQIEAVVTILRALDWKPEGQPCREPEAAIVPSVGAQSPAFAPIETRLVGDQVQIIRAPSRALIDPAFIQDMKSGPSAEYLDEQTVAFYGANGTVKYRLDRYQADRDVWEATRIVVAGEIDVDD